jgi:hypothetical protein
MAQKSFVPTGFIGGLNQNREQNTFEQCSDVRNVWTPNGELQRRPGCAAVLRFNGYGVTSYYQRGGAGSVLQNYALATDTYTSATAGNSLFVTGDVGDVFYISLDSDIVYPAGESFRFFTGLSGVAPAPLAEISLELWVANTNTKTVLRPEYWNGTSWIFCPGVTALEDFAFGGVSGSSGSGYGLIVPADLESCTVNGFTQHWLRFVVQENAMSAGVQVVLGAFGTTLTTIGGTTNNFMEFWGSVDSFLVSAINVDNSHFVTIGSFLQNYISLITNHITSPFEFAPMTMVFVGQESKFFLAGKAGTTEHSINPLVHSWGNRAIVDTSDFATGVGATYDSRVFALESAWPETKIIAFHENKLWSLTDNRMSWSGVVPYHRVWPSLNFEYFEGDNSPLTGAISAWGRLFIFKQNSIRATVYVGDDAFENPRYVAPKVAGIGAVAVNSIKMLGNNRLAFLAEDGLYAMSSDASPYKVTLWSKGERTTVVDRLETLIQSINPAARSTAAGIDWKTASCYLLSVATGSSLVNNTTLVWDYKRDSFWLWEGFVAQQWVSAETEFGDETLYFVNQYAQFFQFGVGSSDNKADIEAYVISQRLGLDSGTTFTLREVNVYGKNTNGNITVDTYVNDSGTPRQTLLDFDDYHEAKLGTFVLGTDKLVAQRQRRRSNTFRDIAESIRVKVGLNNKDREFRVSKVELGVIPLGRR